MLVFDDSSPSSKARDRHRGIFKAPGDRPKQPGHRDWKRADWCSYEGGRLLRQATEMLLGVGELKAANELKAAASLKKKALKVRKQAVILLAEGRLRRRAALKEGYQARSPAVQLEAARLEEKMTLLERAQMHRRQKLWLNDWLAAGCKAPKWARTDTTPEEDRLLWEHEHPGRKLA